MTYPGDPAGQTGTHLEDSSLSALVDGQLPVESAQAAGEHLDHCADCQTRLAELTALVALLRALPDIEPPRDFRLGPRVVVDPPNLVRLRRWYAVARLGASSLAAAFVLLAASSVYVTSQPAPAQLAAVPAAAPAAPLPGAAPTAAPAANERAVGALSAPVPTPGAPAQLSAGQTSAGTSARAPAPAAPSTGAPPAGAAGAARAVASTPANGDASDQVAAATTVRGLPTQVPTVAPTAVPRLAPTTLPVVVQATRVLRPVLQPDNAAPLRIATAGVGSLAVLSIVGVFIVRRRLHSLVTSALE